MGQGISEVIVYAVGVAISLMSIIAVTLMLFSKRARVNGPVFLLGWVLALAVVSGLAYVLADQGNASTSTSASDAIAWGKIVFGVLFLLLAVAQLAQPPGARRPIGDAEVDGRDRRADTREGARPRPAPGGRQSEEPDALRRRRGGARNNSGFQRATALVSLLVFVIVGSLTIAGPVVYYLVGGDDAEARLNEMKDWLAVHNDAVTAVVFLIFGVDLIAKGLPPLS